MYVLKPYKTEPSSKKENLTENKLPIQKVEEESNPVKVEPEKPKAISTSPKPEIPMVDTVETLVELEMVDSTENSPQIDSLLGLADSLNFYDTILTASDSQFISFAKDNFEDTSVAAITVDTSIFEEIAQEPLEIKREVLLGIITLPIRKLEKDTSNQILNTDSVLESISDIKETPSNKTIDVSFWQSPINFIGYKFNGSKLILYGLPFEKSNDKEVVVTNYKENYYFQYLEETYKLKNSLDYIDLELLTDTNLLQKIK